MGGCARESSRTPNSPIAALPMRTAAHRDRGCDAGLARGEGLRRRLAPPQRTRCDRRAAGDEARRRGAARAARRGARPRQGRARRLPICREALPTGRSAAEGKLLEVLLRQKRGELSQAEALRELETLSAIWRGDAIEVKTLAVMAQLYADTGRYAESLAATRTATRLQPNSELIAAEPGWGVRAVCAALSSAPKGEDMKPIDALGMFYEYRELTPIGRRGDEMIRRLAGAAGRGRPAGSGGRTVAVPGRQAAGGRGARAGGRAPGHGLPDQPQAGPRRRGAALDAHRRSLRRIAAAAAAAGSARAKRRRTPRSRARYRLQHSPAARRSGCVPTSTGRQRQWREASEQIELYYADRWRDFKPLERRRRRAT